MGVSKLKGRGVPAPPPLSLINFLDTVMSISYTWVSRFIYGLGQGTEEASDRGGFSLCRRSCSWFGIVLEIKM